MVIILHTLGLLSLPPPPPPPPIKLVLDPCCVAYQVLKSSMSKVRGPGIEAMKGPLSCCIGCNVGFDRVLFRKFVKGVESCGMEYARRKF